MPSSRCKDCKTVCPVDISEVIEIYCPQRRQCKCDSEMEEKDCIWFSTDIIQGIVECSRLFYKYSGKFFSLYCGRKLSIFLRTDTIPTIKMKFFGKVNILKARINTAVKLN